MPQEWADITITKEQLEEVLKELRRMNDILLAMAQMHAASFVPMLAKSKKTVEQVQELPKVRKPTS